MNSIREDIPDCLFFFYYLRGVIDPQGLFRRSSSLSKKENIHKLYFILSFDCDTPEDMKVVWEVHSKVMDLGIIPAYALSGHLLEKEEKVCKRIADTGAEFINHGYTEHAFLDEITDRYKSCFFYHCLSHEQIREEIVKGDRVLCNSLGIVPRGFRTPHFATFQKRDQLFFLHTVLKDLGYHFSTSTIPYFGFRYGPIFDEFGLKEFPLSGGLTKPLNILDSWGYYVNPLRKFNETDYLKEGMAVAKNFRENNYCGILNYYVDPSHIADSDAFFKTIAEWSRIAHSTTYENLLKEISNATS